MCGICGKYIYGTGASVNKEVLARMTKSLYSRGPDEEGFFFDTNVGLGVRRLSIRDKKLGKQPVYSENKNICLVYNGEIYNHTELRDYLLEKGHVFLSGSDGEVIPHLYEEFGDSFIEKLNGMFALALFDARKNNLIIARDRAGIKPLYYAQTGDSFIFSSSVNSLLQEKDISLDMDLQGINCYFTYNYFPCGYSPFKNVKKLLPGSCIVCSPSGIKVKGYQEYDCEKNPIKRDRYAQEFHGVFSEVINDQLQADVPVGIFLSGGLDSSGLAYFASQKRKDLPVFTLGFKEDTYNECDYAAITAGHLGLRHHKFIIEDKIPELFKKTVQSLDIPMGEPSVLPTFHLAGFAKEYCGVVLSGEGADELFGGYDTYKADVLARFFEYLPVKAKRCLFNNAVRLMPVGYGYMNDRLRFELFSKGILSNKIAHYSWREVFSEEEKKLFFSQYLLNKLSAADHLNEPYRIFQEYFNKLSLKDDLEKSMFFDRQIWLADSILQRVDMSSMFHALEVRVPFLDNRVVEFASRLPLNEKISFMKGKRLLKKVFSEGLPKKIINRRKHGFAVPVNKWLCYELKDLCFDIITQANKGVWEFLNRDYLVSLYKAHIVGKADNSRKLWSAVMFISWYDNLSVNKD